MCLPVKHTPSSRTPRIKHLQGEDGAFYGLLFRAVPIRPDRLLLISPQSSFSCQHSALSLHMYSLLATDVLLLARGNGEKGRLLHRK